ncbi:hypothetical protein B0T20DRAFT_83633 [Sordaria brevicollis]|uniref:Uncharacterized protein n=1 Tax=Sordaria brevicollis TaxID=83679 RepID=A0AAE0P1D2_SORBR|nr:hypothetical protein B0T20DRAFT_83633 [Sordaria brevicollis]
MCRQPSEQSVQAALSGIVPSHVTVHSLRPIASLRPQRIFEVNLSDGKTVLLSLTPQALFRLLRHEQSILASEAATVRWLREAIARNHSTRLTYPILQRFLPTLLHASSHGPVELGSAYNVFEHQHGVPIALLPSPPSSLERQRLDKHLGQLYRSLSSITSPSGRFGPVAAVVPKFPGMELGDKSAGFGEGGLMAADGAKNWSTAFQSLLEGILRDGEDMAVTMAYSPIRRHFRRFAHLLNEVKVPRLVVVDLADDTNTLVSVERATKPASTNGYVNYMAAPQPTTTSSENMDIERQLTPSGLQDWSNCVFGDPLLATVFSDGVSESFMEGFETGPSTDISGGSSSRNTSVSTHHSTNTGVMSITAITEQTTLPPVVSSPPPPPPPQPTASDDISSVIEDLPNAGIRLLLYQVYHAALCIVKEFYRPRSSQPPSTCSSPSASGTGTTTSSTPSSLSTNRELEARKKLTEALNRLETAMPVSNLSLSLPSLPSHGNSPSSSSCSSSAGTTKKQNQHLLGSNKSSPVVSARSLLLGVKDGNRSSDSVLAKKKLHHRPSGDMSPAKRAKSAGSEEERE